MSTQNPRILSTTPSPIASPQALDVGLISFSATPEWRSKSGDACTIGIESKLKKL